MAISLSGPDDQRLDFPGDALFSARFSLVAPERGAGAAVVRVSIAGSMVDLNGVFSFERSGDRPPISSESLKIFHLRSILSEGERTYFWTELNLRQTVGDATLPGGYEVFLGGAGARLGDILGPTLKQLLSSAPVTVSGGDLDDTITLPDAFGGLASGGGGADLLTGGAKNDTFYGGVLAYGTGNPVPGEADTIYGNGGNDVIYAGNGDDFIYGGAGHDILIGGPGSGSYYGGAGNDRFLFDADPSDTVDGGKGEDSFVAILDFFDLAGTANLATRQKVFELQRKAAVNRVIDPSDGIAVATSVAPDSHVILKGIEFVEFAKTVADFQAGKMLGDMPLMKLAIIIDRNADGTARGTVMVDGKENAELSALLRDGKGGGMWYDTLTPIDSGSYSGHYKFSSTLNKTIALSGWDRPLGTLTQSTGLTDGEGDTDRTDILIHSGGRNGLSEGCFLTGKAAGFRETAFAALADLYGEDFQRLMSDRKYFPIIPVTVQVNGDAPQPKIRGVDVQQAVAPAADGSTRRKLTFEVDHDEHRIRDKALDVFFKVSGSAKLGVDWSFAKLGESPAANGGGHGTVWLEGMKDGTAIYGVRIGATTANVLKSSVDIAVKIAANKPAEKAEQIKFGIVDLDMITKGSKGWHLYDVSKDSDLDGKANRAERLLLDSDVVATLNIAGGTRFAASWDDTPMG
ncbi:hypothetical protein Q9299_18925 [Gemmobacter fulvus]|uniref:calcium-binding protein n=1 Tax=Gemmobacter fulvus TaxID=2840474 RepID=UPI0027966FDC|nr:hypothetical protein [Gemmobacter fulvus]MDQ1850381.1 hypothetical protein [Gemmobacter fulvus]